jgi:DNA-binding response OmpR family regulator
MGDRDKKKILIVDDEVSIRDMLSEFFNIAGYAALTAASAEEALNILKDNSIEVIFLDLDLPCMNGIELCKTIRKSNQVSIINAFTGYSGVYGLNECRCAGFDDFFIKPIGIESLLKAAEEGFEKVKRWGFVNHCMS